MKRINNKIKDKSGFTLIEIMVAISIFSIVMIITIGALLSINNANKKAQGLRALVDNLNFAIEEMTRKIRTGSDYKCGEFDINGDEQGGVCGDGSTSLSLKTQDKEQVAYYLVGNTIKKKCKSAPTPNTCSPDSPPSQIIAPEIKIDNLQFFVSRKEGLRPVIIISLNGVFNIENNEKLGTKFNLQTTVSSISVE